MIQNILDKFEDYVMGGNATIDERMPFKADIEKMTLENTDYRRVLYTTRTLQLVLMSLLPNEEIGLEKHPDRTQFFRFESGEGLVIVDNKKYVVSDGDAVVVPPDTLHNIINTSSRGRLQLYTIYAPPEHPPGTVEKFKPQE